jgi:hypothetical protein
MTRNIIIHLLNDVEDAEYTRSELQTILGRFADANPSGSTSGSLWFRRMRDKGVIVSAGNDTWSINKNYNIA